MSRPDSKFRHGGLRSLDDVADAAAELVGLMLGGEALPEQLKVARPLLETAASAIMAKTAAERQTAASKAPVSTAGPTLDINRLFEAAMGVSPPAPPPRKLLNEPMDDLELLVLEAAYAETSP
jgi:hypothetical protein